jgi:glycosyltransferase involved in cell wall biosynthesis
MIDSNPQSIKKVKLEAVCDGEYIKWLGHRTDILNLLQKSHIVAFPSYYKEGLPKSLIEAAAVGRPIITTDATGCRDTVEDGYNGYLVPIKDSDALAEKLAILIDNKQLRVEMGRHSRALAERDFSLDDVVAKHLAIYRALVP